MNETVHSTDHATNNNEGRQHENTVMGNAFKELVQKLSGKEEEVATNNVSEVLKNRGVIGESKTADVVSFPFERTEEAQRELGREVGVEVKKIIEKHEQNQNKISQIGDTISHMTSEKSGAIENSPISYRLPEKASEETPPIMYRSLDGIVMPTREQSDAKQNTDTISEETAAADEELGRSFLYDETIARINKEIDGVKQKAKEATKQLRDHTKDASEPQKTLRQIDKQMSELNRERAEHIRDKIRNASIEEVRAIQNAAHNVMVNHAEKYKTEAVDALRAADDRIKELEATEGTGKTPETTAPHVEATQEVSHKKQPLQEELVRIEIERASLIKKQRENGVLTIGEQIALDTLTNRMKILRGKILLNPTEETIPVMNEATHTESTTPEESQSVPETATPVSSQPETVIPEKQEEVVILKEGGLNPFEKSIARIRSEDPARAERLLAAIGASPEQKERIEKLLGATQIQKEKIETEAKEKGVLDTLRGWGEQYQKIPLKWKLGIGAALIGGAFATGGVGILGSVFTLGITARRGMVGLGTFVTVESLGRKWVDSSKLWENDKEMGRKFATAGGVIAGVLAAGGAKTILDYYQAFQGEVIPPIKLPDEITAPQEAADAKALREYATAISPEEKAQIAKIVGRTTAEMDAQTATHAAAESTSSIMTPGNEIIGHAADKMIETSYAVHGGDNLWNIIKEKIPEIQGLDGEGRQSNAIANIIEQIKKDPEGFGISSGNVDTLSTGDTIDLEKVRGVLDNTKISVGGHEASIIERAEGLSDTEISTIEANNEKLAEWQAEHPGEQLTTETTNKILNEPSGTETPSENFDNVRKDMETVEATSMKTEQIFRADIQKMFGSKGFFGYGFLGTNGERSIDWLDLKGRTVDEVLSKKFVGIPAGEEGAVQKFGIDSFSAVDKIREHIYMLVEKAGAETIPEPNESVEHFLKRSINVIVSKK